MNKLLILLIAFAALAPLAGHAGDIPPLSLSTYATLGFENFDGDAEGGVGAELAVGLSSTISLYGFAEADGTEHSAIDRFGGGARVTGKLGKYLRPFAGLGAGYDAEREATFLRPEAGAFVDIWKFKSATLSLLGKYGLDVNTRGQAGQRLSGGLSLSF